MNFYRMEEVQEEQKKLNSILKGWDVSMNEDDYYSLRNTLIDLIAYSMTEDAELPKVNPLVKKYLK